MSTCAIMSKKLPEGVKSPEAEIMVENMWKSLGKEAWDTTKYVTWSFRGAHNYWWDKEANLAQITWKENKVLLNPNEINGVAYTNDLKVEGEEAQKLIEKAWTFWCNDMFWLTAPFKVKDAGTSLSIVEEDEVKKLKVTYTSGGTTPGDSYIWELNADGTPKSYEMYTQILPLKGISVPWSEWVTLSTGAKLCSEHSVMGSGLKLENIAGGNQLSDIGLSEDIWKVIR